MVYDTHMRRISLFILLLACAFSASPALAAPAATTPTVALQATNPTADATVNLYCRLTSGRKIFTTSGSGVFISDRGVILTNAHVAQYFLLAGEKGRVRGSCSVRTGSPANETYTASVLYFPPAWIDANAEALKKRTMKGTGESDFALLYVTGATSGTLPVTFPSLPLWLIGGTEGELVTVAGYPTMNLDTDDVRNHLSLLLSHAVVTNVRGFTHYGNDVLTIASSTAASAGVSGGPVIREGGAVTGIVVAKSNTLLRAITLAHINTELMTHTGASLFGMFAGDLALRAEANHALITPKQLIVLRDALLKAR